MHLCSRKSFVIQLYLQKKWVLGFFNESFIKYSLKIQWWRERHLASRMYETCIAWEFSALCDVHIVLHTNKTHPKRRYYLFSFNLNLYLLTLALENLSFNTLDRVQGKSLGCFNNRGDTSTAYCTPTLQRATTEGCKVEVCTGSNLKPEPGPYPRSPDPTRPDPSGTVKFRARTRPETPPPPPAPQRIIKKKEKGCISRLHAKKRINQGSAISQTFTSYESLWTSGAAVIHSAEFMNFVWTRWWPCKLWSFFVS